MKTGKRAGRLFGFALLLLALLAATTCEDPTSVILDLSATSGPPDPEGAAPVHYHGCTIPGRDITVAPLEGATYRTTTVNGHTHTVTLSHQQLVDLQQPHAAMLITSSTDQGHAHTFLFER